MKVGSLFSGIGGLDLGLERAGMSVVWQCESDPYCRAVLRKHWPDVPCFEDVRDITADAPAVDLLCGGFPCQPVSQAGNRRGTADDRWLWPEFARVVRLLRPSYVLVENVPGLLTANRGDAMGEVLGTLAESGYDAEWDGIPAAAVGAPHLRDRVFIVAYADGERYLHGEPQGLPAETREPALSHAGASGAARAVRRETRDVETLADPTRVFGCRSSHHARGRGEGTGAVPEPRDGAGSAGPLGGGWPAEPDVGRVADGIPDVVDRLRCLGNAVVPQVAQWIGERIMTAERLSSSTKDDA